MSVRRPAPTSPGTRADGRWWTLSGVEVLDLMGTVERMLSKGRVVHIGTDAQKASSRMEFVTVACVLNPGKGGRVFYTRRHDRKEMSLYEKLSTETWLSLDLAIRMHEAFTLSAWVRPQGDFPNAIHHYILALSQDDGFNHVMLRMSSGRFRVFRSSPGKADRRILVRVAPGFTQFTRSFDCRCSSASTCDNPSVANLDAA